MIDSHRPVPVGSGTPGDWRRWEAQLADRPARPWLLISAVVICLTLLGTTSGLLVWLVASPDEVTVRSGHSTVPHLHVRR